MTLSAENRKLLEHFCIAGEPPTFEKFAEAIQENTVRECVEKIIAMRNSHKSVENCVEPMYYEGFDACLDLLQHEIESHFRGNPESEVGK